MDRRTLLSAMAAAPAAGLANAALAQPAMPDAPAGAAPRPGTPTAITVGRLKVPARNSLPPLAPKVDYEALRQRRLAEVDPETRYINLPSDRRPRPKVSPDPDLLAPGVKAFNIEYAGPTRSIPMRIYMPENHRGPIGLYLHTHGGGWAAGAGFGGWDAENSGYVRDWGCAVALPDFRVSWEAKFPAAPEDCFAGYKHILAQAGQLGVDPTRIGIGGGCTGANIATVVSLMARDAGIQKPAIQWLPSGVFDTRNDNESYYEFADYALPREIAEAVTRLYLRSQEDTWDWRASPLLAPTLKGASPALIWSGEWEILRDEARQYAGRLRDEGVEVTYIEGPKQPHGGINARNPDTGEPTRYAQATWPQICAIMRRHIGPRRA